jgi:SET domain-containing protein
MIVIDEDNAPDTYVGTSTVDGYGLFASKNFKAGELILAYTSDNGWYEIEISKLTPEQIAKNWYIMLNDTACTTSDITTKFSYINHNRNPNCLWHIRQKKITASRDILVDEELFIDYRDELRPNRTEFPTWI